MRSNYHQVRCVSSWLILLLPGVIMLGCDRPPPMDPEVPQEQRIRRLVLDVDDFAQTPKELKIIPRLFAAGSEPSKEVLPRYADYHYDAKPPVISGDSATIAVAITDAKSGEHVDEVQWSSIKVNNVWRLKDAPLPAAKGDKP